MVRNVQTFLVEKTFFVSLEERKATDLKLSKKSGSVITISRQHGCYGAEIAIELQKLLDQGWVVFHREILESIAKDTGVEKQYVAEFDERTVQWIDEIIRGFDKQPINDSLYLTHLKKLLNSLANMGKVIIIGRGANFLLREGFHVRLVAPTPIRINNLINRNHYSKNQAEQEIEEADKQRRRYIKNLFNAEVDDPQNYDLTINIKNLTINNAARLIYDAAQISNIFK